MAKNLPSVSSPLKLVATQDTFLKTSQEYEKSRQNNLLSNYMWQAVITDFRPRIWFLI